MPSIGAPWQGQAVRLMLAVWIAVVPLACTSIRPVAKIGLLAPFEGLYRRTGYGALAAMQAALAEAPPATLDLLPLALDSSRDPLRTAQKLLADQSVQAVVGPFTLQTAALLQPLLAEPSVPWFITFAVEPRGGFVPLNRFDRWAQPLVMAAAEAAQRQGCQRLVVAGWPTTWPAEVLASSTQKVGLDLALGIEPAGVQPDDAVLHLGPPAAAADFANALQKMGQTTPLYLGPQGADPVFFETNNLGAGVFWLAWLDENYPAWASNHASASPSNYAVYRATQVAVSGLRGTELTDVPPWHLQWFVQDAAGVPQAVERPLQKGCRSGST